MSEIKVVRSDKKLLKENVISDYLPFELSIFATVP